ncbi:MAG: hypothetical protein FJW36_01060 [Acidobacteria bacterium]|nr:hypothetical protein [Acidobacteriota bacterium]
MSFWLAALLAFAQQDEARQLPPLWRAVALLGQIEQDSITSPAARLLAIEAYAAALEADLDMDLKDYPRALKALGSPEAIQARAWLAVRQHREPKDQIPPFPQRRRTTPAKCSHSEVDHAVTYLQLTLRAGPEAFLAAIPTLRSAVEIGEALDLLSDWQDPRAVPTGLELIDRLRRATSSRQEYAAAKDLRAQIRRFQSRAPESAEQSIEENWQYFEARNQALESCSGQTPSLEEENFSTLKAKVLRSGGTPATEYEFVEQFLRLYEMARSEEPLMAEIEQAGDPRLRLLIRAFRSANRRTER